MSGGPAPDGAAEDGARRRRPRLSPSRRAVTLALASGLAVGLAAAATVTPVPYVALGAGPTYDTLGTVGSTPVIAIEGARTYPTTGELRLTTVGVQPGLTLVEALSGWLDRDLAVVPRDVVYPPDQTEQEVDQANEASMVLSQSSATTAALRALGIPVGTEVVVRAVGEGLPAEGRLEPGDVVRSVDGEPVTSSEELRRAVSARQPGEAVSLVVVRDGAERTVELVTAASEDAPPRPVIGVEPQDRADYPFEVMINLEEVGGPSAGLMFALGIVDKLDPEPLTGGLDIAGTGEISPEGEVGPIGGIPQKLLGAKERGATVFLTPAANCAEALGTVPEGLRLVRVATLDDALQALRGLRDGGPVPSCASTAASGS